MRMIHVKSLLPHIQWFWILSQISVQSSSDGKQSSKLNLCNSLSNSSSSSYFIMNSFPNLTSGLNSHCLWSFSVSLPQEREGEFHRCYSGWWSPGVSPSSFLPAGQQGQDLAPPLCSAPVPQLVGEGHRQRGRGAGRWEEGRLWDPEENGEGETLTSHNQHWRTP